MVTPAVRTARSGTEIELPDVAEALGVSQVWCGSVLVPPGDGLPARRVVLLYGGRERRLLCTYDYATPISIEWAMTQTLYALLRHGDVDILREVMHGYSGQ